MWGCYLQTPSVLCFAYGGICPGRVESVSPIELTTPGWRHSRLRGPVRDFHPVLSPSCETEDSLSGEGLQVCLEQACPGHQLPSNLPTPRARRYGQKEVPLSGHLTACWILPSPHRCRGNVITLHPEVNSKMGAGSEWCFDFGIC